jgi:hypothetical protein
MANFRVWGRVERVGPADFFVIASAVPERQGDERVIVLTWTSTNLFDANGARCRLMIEVGKAVRARGDTVVDVED